MEGDPKVIISRLEKDLNERNVELHKAAKIGNELLKEKQILSEKFEHINSENEVLKQEKYSLQLDLDTQKQIVSTQSSEIESQRDQCDRLARKVDRLKKENLAQKEQITNFEREKCDMEKHKEDLQHENQVLKTKLDFLKNEVQELKMKTEASENLDATDQESCTENNVDYYRCINNQLNEALSDLKQELEAVKSSEQREKKKVEELQEVLKEKNKELAAYSVEVQEAKEHAAELQFDVEKFKLEQTDQNRKGNSVFGEIDDRRKIIEKEYKILAKKYEDLGQRYRTIKKDLVLCKDQMSSMTSRKYHERHIEILKSQLYNAKDDLEHLSNKVYALMREKGSKNVMTSNSGEYGYLVAMHKEDEKEIKELERDMLRLMRQKMADDATISQLRDELYRSQTDLDDAIQKNFKLQLEMKDISLFRDPEESTNQGEVSVREFDPNQINGNSNIRKSSKEGLNKTTKMESMNHVDSNKSHIENTPKPVINMGVGKKDFKDKFDPKDYIRSAEYNALKTRYANQDQRKQPKDVQCAQQ